MYTRSTTSLGEVRQPHAPANLIELGYHDNYADAIWIESSREMIAQALARGLTEYFGLPFIYPQAPRAGVVTTGGSPLRLRDYPGTPGNVLAMMPNGANVTIYGAWQGWYVVHYGNLVGYAAEAYIEG